MKIERKELKAQEKIAEERRKIFEDKQKAEFEAKYWSMMNDPKSELYKTCFSRISKISKKQWSRNGSKYFSFQADMRTEFAKLLKEKVKKFDKD